MAGKITRGLFVVFCAIVGLLLASWRGPGYTPIYLLYGLILGTSGGLALVGIDRILSRVSGKVIVDSTYLAQSMPEYAAARDALILC